MTIHSQGKSGTHIDRVKYELMKTAILQYLETNGPTAFNALMGYVNDSIGEDFHGSVGWYYTTVKLDLETRGIIVCDRKSSPQIVKLPDTV